MRRSLGLLGRVVAILLLILVMEFAASTVLYERASRYSVQEDEARRLAEHLVISRKLMAERPRQARALLARELTTDRYEVSWAPGRGLHPVLAPRLDEMRRQIVAWEPELAQSGLTLRLPAPTRPSLVTGELRLPDGSWLRFSTRHIAQGWQIARDRIALALLPALVLLLLGALLIRRTLRPLKRLEQATDRVGLDSPVTVAEQGPPEVRRLIRAFNDMHLRIERLIAERTEALAAVSHDLRTPLARLQFRLDAVAEPEARRAIGGDIDEMEAMLASLLAYIGGEDDPERPVLTDVAVLAATIVDDRVDRGDTASYVGPDHAEAIVRPSALRRALSNLVENALHYGAAAIVRLEQDADGLCLIVDDDGPGIPEERQLEVLRPFTRLDQARERNTQGLGLGLSIVARVVNQEGGTLRLSNRPEGGLRVAIRLPPGPTPA